MEPSKGNLSLYSLARNKPWLIVLLSGVLLGLSFPPSPLNFFIHFAFVPLFVLMEVVPERVFEDKVLFYPKALLLSVLRLLTWPIRKFIPGIEPGPIVYHRKIISGNAQIFRYTYLTFLLWNFMTCYWLMLTAFGAETFSEALVNASAGLVAILINPALMAIPFQIYSRIRQVFPPLFSAICLAVIWIGFEHLHFNWELSWSWLTLGHSLASIPPLIQYAEITGVEGISLHILITNLLIYYAYRKWRLAGKLSLRRFSFIAAWLLAPILFNLLLLRPSRDVFQSSGELGVRIVQPNIDPYESQLTREAHIEKFAELIRSRPLDSIDLILLPEGAIPKTLKKENLRNSRLLRPLWEIVDSNQLSILTGFTERRAFFPPDEIPANAIPGRGKSWIDHTNAATVLRPAGEAETHQKGKLVPMVERMPFLETISSLKSIGINPGYGGYGLPDTVFPLTIQDSIRTTVMICYESEFGEWVARESRQNPDFLSVITEDGWWGKSSGYVQHAHLSTLRAVENRRDLARCANTGRSLFVDSKGNVTQATDFGTETIIDGKIKLYRTQTFYVKHGDWIGRGALMAGILLILLATAVSWSKTLHDFFAKWIPIK